MMKNLEIYIHIPFCVQKCAYCDFLSFPSGRKTRAQYAEALCREILEADIGAFPSGGGAEKVSGVNEGAEHERGINIVSVFFGGGTPSVPETEEMEKIMSALRARFVIKDPEISMEMNPGTVDRNKLEAYRDMGVNRISIGCQSMDDELLARLGRIHRRKDFLECYSMAKDAGFNNINIDLMSALPGETFDMWKHDLISAAELGPEHISAYSLIIEEGTPFFQMQKKGMLDLPDEEEERRMYRETGNILRPYGYHQYEISNYAKDGYECRHNLGYWTGTDYIGFGLGASSYIDGVRFRNTGSMRKYLKGSAREDIEILTTQDMQSEYMILGLRLNRGVGGKEFERRFGVGMMSVFGDVIEKYMKAELLRKTEEPDDFRISLTDRGFSLSNVVMADMLL